MHNILYRTFGEKTPRNEITRTVLRIVQSNGDRYGTESVNFYDRVFNNEDEAREWIDKNDGFYKGIAVKVYDFSAVKNTQKIDDLQARIAENERKRSEYIKAHSVKSFKSQFIGCQCCGSKLNKDRLRNDRCPLCLTDLRAESTLERIKSFDAKRKDLEAKIAIERQKQKDKAQIVWLVKFEYHS